MSEATGSLAREKRAQELVVEALDLQAAARAAFLDEACAGDTALRALVEELLSFDAAGEPALDRLPEALLAGAATEMARGDATTLSGESAYRLISQIGRGGFGSVYLAERSDGAYRQRVAVKRLNLGAFASPASRARLRQERQILARLSHPHIARLLDGGEMADGAPFLVLEYIDGVPIDVHCAERGLDVAARLRLFLAVCEAVEFAHRSLVVHRDLKPANVLVDGTGQVKLLDFGIAKLLDPDEASPLETRKGEAPLTPRYASPEQVRGEAVTTATDVYSLGVLLYELLTGRSPYESAATPFALARAVCDSDPLRPSTVTGSTAPVTPRWWRRRGPRVDADLDAVVLKAMRKEPAERYGSAAALAEDLERFLAGLPVLARKGSASYRFGKLVRRHKVAFAAAAALALVVAGFSVSLALQLAETERQRAEAERQRFEAERQREAAERERDVAQKVSDFLVDAFRLADPIARAGRDLSARQLLDSGAARLANELGNEPETRARLLLAIGRGYRELHEYAAAEPLLTEALALRERLPPRDSEATAEAAFDLAVLRVGQARFAEARQLMARAVAISERLMPDDDPRLSRAINGLAHVTEQLGDYRQAAALSERSLLVARRSGEPRRLGTQLNNLGYIYQRLARYERAKALYVESQAVLEGAFGKDFAIVGYPVNNLGETLVLEGRPDEAEPLFQRTLSMAERIYGPQHVLVAAPLTNLGNVRLLQGRPAEARDFYRRALAVCEGAVGPHHPSTAVTLQAWGELERGQGRLAPAIGYLRRALAIREQSLGADHPLTAQSLHGLGLALLAAGDPAGRPLLERALGIRRASLPADHPDLRATAEAFAALGPPA